MQSSQLQEYNKKYIDICNKIGKKFLNDYDKYSILLSFKIQKDSSANYVLSKIKAEAPISIITDERLFNFLTQSDDVKVSSLDVATAEGYWANLNGIKFYFCNKYFQSNMTKIILYNRSEKNSLAMNIFLD